MDIAWVAVDWGTSQLRVWAMDANNQVLQGRQSPQGMGQLQQGDYEQVFLELIADWLPENSGKSALPVWVCGMAGSREGWQEAPYVSAPLSVPQQLRSVAVTTDDARIQVHLIPGVKQIQPANVMRGEETQLAGFLLKYPTFDGLIALPGTHTKWLKIHNAVLEQFSTTMTGELFKLISEQSILRHSMSAKEWQPEVFQKHLKQAIDKPLNIYEQLFTLRATDLLKQAEAGQAYMRLSAQLMALEIMAIKQSFLKQADNQLSVAIIGSSKLGILYQAALQTAGIKARSYSGEDLVISGLRAIKEQSHHD